MNKVVCCLAFILLSFQYIYADSSAAEIFLKRHSGKKYDASRSLTQEQLHCLVEATRWTPSAYNDQPWSFIFCDRDRTPEAYAAILSNLQKSQKPWVADVPLFVIVTTRSQTLKKNKFNLWAEYDTGAAAMSFALQAAELGLMAHQMGGFELETIVQDFHLPTDVKPITVIAIGYESKEPDPAAQPRERYPDTQNFFLGSWGEPLFPK